MKQKMNYFRIITKERNYYIDAIDYSAAFDYAVICRQWQVKKIEGITEKEAKKTGLDT